MPSPQSRNFLFTIQYNAEPPAVPSVDAIALVCKYMCYQSEMAPTTGQLHIQGFIHYAKKIRASSCKEDVCVLFGVASVHIVVGDGKAQAMAEYCQKEESRLPGTTPFVYGELNKPGQTNVGKTLSTMYTKWKSGTTIEDMVVNPDTCALAMRYAKSFQYVLQSSIKPRDYSYEHVVWVCYGPPGTGKSTWLETNVRDLHGTDKVYMKPEGTKWWDGYVGQKHVIMNEFDGTWCTPTLFNTWCDKFATQVETKGGYCQLATVQTYITTNRYPSHWWSSKVMKGRLSALWRRITKVLEFSAVGVDPVIWDDIDAFRAHHSYDESCAREDLYGPSTQVQ